MSLYERVELCTLFDIYGALLTERQAETFVLHFHEDLSLGEISEQLGISRPAVADHLKRAESFLREIDDKLRLKDRLSSIDSSISFVLSVLSLLNQSLNSRCICGNKEYDDLHSRFLEQTDIAIDTLKRLLE